MPEMPKPSQPLRPAERFPRPFLRGRRCRLLHFQPAAERLREAFLLPAAELRSAWLAARTSPAFGARPHGCPSYNPLCATVSLRVHTVNMESPSASYRSNPDMPKGTSRRCAQDIDIGVVSRPADIRTRRRSRLERRLLRQGKSGSQGFGEIERVSFGRDPF